MPHSTDRNLLVGILALQMDFVQREPLLTAMNAWLLRKTQPLEEVLLEQGALTPDTVSLLRALVNKHLELHGNDPEQSLRSLTPLEGLPEELCSLPDPDIYETISRVIPATDGGKLDTAASLPQRKSNVEVSDHSPTLLDAICDGFVQAWRRGQRPQIEEFVQQAPEHARASLVEQLIREEVHLRRAAGEQVSPADYLGRFPQAVKPGSSSRFEVLRPHAKGGLGEVFVARDTELNREVALKEIQSRYSSYPESRARFLLEAEVTGRLEHPGIVPVYGLGQYADGRPFYAMRFIKGDSLKDAIEQFHKQHRTARDFVSGEVGVEFRKLLGRFLDVCEAIEYAHSRGVLHRDLKPGNIMLGKYGETLVVDWGLAKVVGRPEEYRIQGETTLVPESGSGSAPTQFGSAVGTPAFMSPEQAAGRLDDLGPAADSYSLGATLYCLLSGVAPYGGEDARDLNRLLDKIQRGEFPPPRTVEARVPPALQAICLKAMARHPVDRYASPRALANDVEHWLADEKVSVYQDSWLENGARWLRRHRGAALSGGIALALVAVVATLAAVLIETARHREAVARQIAESTKRFDLQLLQETDFTLESLMAYAAGIADLNSLGDSAQAETKYSALRNRFLDSMRARLDLPRFDGEAKAAFDRTLASFAEAFPQRAEEVVRLLAPLRDGRYADWNTLVDAAAPGLEPRSIGMLDGNVEIKLGQGGQLVRQAGDGEQQYVPVLAIDPGSFRWRVGFDSTWINAPVVGIKVQYETRDGNAAGYEFLLAVPQFDYRRRTQRELAELRPISSVLMGTGDKSLQFLVLRNDQLLRNQRVTVTPEPIELSMERVENALRGSITLASGDLPQADIAFLDPFPLASRAGSLGVIWPNEVGTRRFYARVRYAPPVPSPLEQADELLGQRRFAEALETYERLPETAETRYKRALCHKNSNETTYRQSIDALAQEPLVAGGRDEQWVLLARMERMLATIREGDWETLRRQLVELKTNYSSTAELAQTLALLPAEERNNLASEIGKVGLRSRLAFARREDLDFLNAKEEYQQILQEDPSQRRLTMWRKADVLRMSDLREHHQAADQVLRELVVSATDPRERRILLADLAWLWTAELARPEEALAVVDRWLLQDGEFAPAYLPLLAERARIHLAIREQARASGEQPLADHALQQAQADLEALAKLPSDAPVLTYVEFAQGQLLRGLILADAGESPAAERCWTAALRRNWHAGPLQNRGPTHLEGVEGVLLTHALICDGLAVAKTAEVTREEAQRMVTNHLGGSGVSGALERTLTRTLFESRKGTFGPLTPPEFLRRLVTQLYSSPRGQETARRLILRTYAMRDYHVQPFCRIIETAVQLTGFADGQIPEQLEPYVHEGVQQLVEMYESGTEPDRHSISEREMLLILEIWSGVFTTKKWDSLRTTLEGQGKRERNHRIAPSVALALGLVHEQAGLVNSAKTMLGYAAEHPDAHPEIGDAARAALLHLGSPNSPAAPPHP